MCVKCSCYTVDYTKLVEISLWNIWMGWTWYEEEHSLSSHNCLQLITCQCFVLHIQPGAFMTWLSAVRHCLNDCMNWRRISTKCLIHKRFLIPCSNGRALGYLCEYCLENLPRYKGTAMYKSLLCAAWLCEKQSLSDNKDCSVQSSPILLECNKIKNCILWLIPHYTFIK